MNSLFNKKWMAWLVMVLLALNLSAFGTFVYLLNAHRADHQEDPPPQAQAVGREIVRELGMDSAQARTFHELRREFFSGARPHFRALRENRLQIIEELREQEPDTSLLDRLTDSTGSIQARLKRESIRHYLRVRQICTPGQQEKLLMIYRQMLMIDEPGRGPGEGFQHRRGWRRDSLQDRPGLPPGERMGRGMRGMRDRDGSPGQQ